MKRLIAAVASTAMLLSGLALTAAPAAATGGAGGTVECTGPATATVGQPYTLRWKLTPATGFTIGAGQMVVVRFGSSLVGSADPSASGTNEGDITFTPQQSGARSLLCAYVFQDVAGTSPELESTSYSLTVNAAPAPPTLSGISPTSATEAGGGTADISGANLAGATSVTIGAKAASIVAATDGTVVVSIPTAGTNPVGTAVDVTVTTPAGSATLPAAFTYTSNPPSVSGVTPSCGVTAGTALVIDGYRFTGATAVTIGGQSVPFTVTSNTSITTTAPSISGSQAVIVTTPAGSNGGQVTVTSDACAPLPPLTLTVASTTPAGGFATIQWSFPSGDPNLANVRGLQYALAAGGPYVNVGGTQSGTSGEFTVAGLTKSPVLVWVKTVNASPVGKDSVKAVGVRFTSTPTALPPNTGNAGSVPSPAQAAAATAASTGSGSSSSGSSSSGSSSGNGSGSGSGGGSGAPADGAAVGAPCLAPAGSLYPVAFGTVGSQLVVVPGRPGEESPTQATVTSGALPPGMGLDSLTGIVYGVPTAAGRYSASIAGRYANGSKATGTLDITIDNDAQTLTYPVLVAGGVGQTMTTGPTTNAPAGSTYEIVCGKVPPGTTFDPRTGIISGTPTTEDLENPPLRIVERNAAGSATASFIFVVGPAGAAQLSYPAHPHLRLGKRATLRPTVVAAGDLLYFKVIRGKLTKGLRLNPKTGVITGKPQRAGKPHTVTIAGVHSDGTLVVASPMTITVRRHR